MPDINKPDYLNSFGLINGKIPIGTSCYWLSSCVRKEDYCPNGNNKENDFSCAYARGLSLIELTENVKE